MRFSTEGSHHGPSLSRSSLVVKSRAVGAFVPTGTGRLSERIPAFGAGRVCGAPDCDTVLSTYNPAPYCSVHDAAGTSRRRS